ncbi:ParD-like family protein [Azohydromonas caseinilytica]|uniref:ParD-like family protein n=1 Tax=Azohydromonas caseinilytica TaxID=2728836 RepID=A0A848F8V0_9BURK|nr:ParD-like family protein [Azohydromonas caseinilytica]NML15782.1 ParD-like family protein [Azohydromonas caseinilytica]
MGLVKISEPMHENVRVASGALNRSINAQAEHWMRIGMLCELHPELRYGDLCRLLIEDEIRAEAQVAALERQARA